MRLRADRARALRGARRRRLRRRLLAAARRPRRARRAHPRARARRDGAGLGGQPRVADLRADRHLDRLPERVRRRSPRRSAIPLFIAGIGIVLRGAAYALRAGAASARELRAIDLAVRALLDADAVRARHRDRRDRRASACPSATPPATLFSSWLNPTCAARSACSRSPTRAYLAAVFLAADARRRRAGAGDASCVDGAAHARARAGRGRRRRRARRAASCCTPTRTTSTRACCTAARSRP